MATNSLLVVREGTKPPLVKTILRVLHAEKMRLRHRELLSHEEVRNHLSSHHFHETARAYYDPFDPGTVANYVDALAGSKDLVVAMFAGVYLLWRMQRQRQKMQQQKQVDRQRQRLVELVDATVRIEADQMELADREQLEQALAQLTGIKLKAFKELTHDEIYSDRRFLIFVMQCSHVISQIQRKMIMAEKESGQGV